MPMFCSAHFHFLFHHVRVSIFFILHSHFSFLLFPLVWILYLVARVSTQVPCRQVPKVPNLDIYPVTQLPTWRADLPAYLPPAYLRNRLDVWKLTYTYLPSTTYRARYTGRLSVFLRPSSSSRIELADLYPMTRSKASRNLAWRNRAKLCQRFLLSLSSIPLKPFDLHLY